MLFTVIILAILALLYTFLYMQQKAIVVGAASFAAQQGAELWTDSRKSMEHGKIDGEKPPNPISYRVFDNLLFTEKTFEGHIVEEKAADSRPRLVLKMDTGDSLPDRKAVLIGEALCKKLEGAVLRPESTRVRIRYSNNIIRGRIYVEIIQEIKIPLVGIAGFFGGGNTLTLAGRASAAVAEPAEYIRNVDLALELSERLKEKLDLMGLIDKVRSKGLK